jgi:D-arabinose 1-dehydrogenase-like Zn-dependent alcohol dehydrogenase
MKAVVVHQYGGPEVLKFEEYPDPVPGPGEALLRVAATSVNPVDYKRRAGLTKDFYPIKFPGLIGVDIAGTVVKIGLGVEGFSVGDQVFARSLRIGCRGTAERRGVPICNAGGLTLYFTNRGHERKIGNEKRPARNQPCFEAQWRWAGWRIARLCEPRHCFLSN